MSTTLSASLLQQTAHDASSNPSRLRQTKTLRGCSWFSGRITTVAPASSPVPSPETFHSLAAMPVNVERAEAPGSNPHLQNLPGGQRRVPIRNFRPTPSPHLRRASPRGASSRCRYRTRARNLTMEQESSIRALAGTKSLRSLAADFDVSHKTIRALVRQE